MQAHNIERSQLTSVSYSVYTFIRIVGVIGNLTFPGVPVCSNFKPQTTNSKRSINDIPGLVKSSSVSLLTSKILLSDVGDPLSIEMSQTGTGHAPPLAMVLFLPGCRSSNNTSSLPDALLVEKARPAWYQPQKILSLGVQSGCSSTSSLRACDGIGEGSGLVPSDICKKIGESFPSHS